VAKKRKISNNYIKNPIEPPSKIIGDICIELDPNCEYVSQDDIRNIFNLTWEVQSEIKIRAVRSCRNLNFYAHR
jgi:hypothetical protein